MERQWITAPAPRRGRAAWTVAGSVILHGSLVALAALWPVHGAVPPPEPPPTSVIIDQPLGDPEPPVPESNPARPDALSDPPPLAANDSEDTPPMPEEPSLEVSTPRPVLKAFEGKPKSSHPAVPGVSSLRTAQAAIGATAGAGRPGAAGQWRTPQPPYPYAMRAARIGGSGRVRITTDAAGRVTVASVVQSTSNALLDDNTCRFARTEWSGPPNSTVTVPITYRMQ